MSKIKKAIDSYESAMEELQQIVDAMQQEQIGIDELSAKAKRAAELIAFCREKLRATDAEIGGLFETDSGMEKK